MYSTLIYTYDILDRIFLELYAALVEYMFSGKFLSFFLATKDYGKSMTFTICSYLTLSALIGRNKQRL